MSIVIAHRGASGYLPEHTLEAKALAVAQGAHYLEQDVAMTSDDELVVIHDHYLDRISNVAERFPERRRPDGRFYVLDFTLEEVRSLRVTSPVVPVDGRDLAPEYPGRFPPWSSRFDFHTLSEELEFIRGINYATGRQVGIYTELKAPWLHRDAGKDIASATYAVLKSFGYDSRDGSAYLQCFDPDELRRIKSDLGPSMGVDLPLIQLIADTQHQETRVRAADGTWELYESDWMMAPGGLEPIAEYADGIGPDYHALVSADSAPGDVRVTTMVDEAHDAGMLVHPYTVRADVLPPWARDVNEVFSVLYDEAGVDGLFTDFPDLAVGFLARSTPTGASRGFPDAM